MQARAVADCVSRHLAVRAAKVPALPGRRAAASARYAAARSAARAGVPAVFRTLPVGTFDRPGRRRGVEAAATGDSRYGRRQSLGDLPPQPKPSATLVSREIHPRYVLESLTIPNGVDGEMTALFLVPRSLVGKKAPAILWLHSSSYDARQLLMRGYNGGDEPLGETFAKAGYVVLAPDACWYGGRAGKGPTGPRRRAGAARVAVQVPPVDGPDALGHVRPRRSGALDYLCTRPEVDCRRIGATGISMGSTRAWWLAALDERIACVVGVACLTRYQNLLAHGELRQHGVYYFVFGLLKHFDIEAVVALIAPRPFLALNGDFDAGSPADGIRDVEAAVGKVYRVLGVGANFRSVVYKDTGHVYTAAMRKEMLAWFATHLKAK